MYETNESEEMDWLVSVTGRVTVVKFETTEYEAVCSAVFISSILSVKRLYFLNLIYSYQ